MADDRTIADLDRTDDTGRGFQGRLDSIANVLVALHRRSDNVNATFSPPPDDDKPEMRTTLASIRNEAQAIIDVADAITAKLG